jgi:hypothetical protein
MRFAVVTSILCLFCGITAAQQGPSPTPPPLPVAFSLVASSTDVQALIAQMKREHKDQVIMLRPLMQVPGYAINLEYRLAPARAVIHETDSELIYVIDGKGTLTTGGTLINPQRQNAQNIAGTGIAGGTPHLLGKGDFVLLQNGMTHSFTAIDGELIVISLRLPAPPPK